MISVEEVIPEFVLEWSLAFKSAIIVIGALLLLFSSMIRPLYPFLWMVPFLSGALIEWLIVATVYTEMSQMEKRIDKSKSEIKQAQSQIESTRTEIETARSDIASTQREVENTKYEIESIQEEVEAAQSDIESTQNEVENTKSEIEDMRDNTFSFISDSQGIGAKPSIEDRLSDVEDKLGIGSYSRNNLESRLSDLENTVKKLERNSGGRY